MKYTKELHDTISEMINGGEFDGYKAMRFDIEFIKAMHSEIDRLHEAERWIPVSEPPKTGYAVIVYDRSETVLTDHIFLAYLTDSGEWVAFEAGVDYVANPTHWQPLPTPPEGE